jgi:hypothetical protein
MERDHVFALRLPIPDGRSWARAVGTVVERLIVLVALRRNATAAHGIRGR